ncbi:MAG: ribosomal RNA small subunit methyltransferase A [Deltaproteobacteria bacterium]|nr:ribosomal RNA small subunit methyltransferase A [Deltaproteobacteria bacterium]
MSVKSDLVRLGVKPSKERGQNFLIDSGVVEEIIRFGHPTQEDTIVEIGPGLGALTKELSNFPKLTLIEIESSFCLELTKKFESAKIVNEDVRFVDFSKLGADLLIFGNLPYSFSTDIVFHLIGSSDSISRAVLLLQKEFVERMAAQPGSKAFGTLSIGCQLFAKVRSGPVFDGSSFHPAANVDSQLVELDFYKESRFGFDVSDKMLLRQIVESAFHKRRKKIANSMKLAAQFSSEVIDQALAEAGVDSDARAEHISLQSYVDLTKAFKKFLN